MCIGVTLGVYKQNLNGGAVTTTSTGNISSSQCSLSSQSCSEASEIIMLLESSSCLIKQRVVRLLEILSLNLLEND